MFFSFFNKTQDANHILAMREIQKLMDFISKDHPAFQPLFTIKKKIKQIEKNLSDHFDLLIKEDLLPLQNISHLKKRGLSWQLHVDCRERFHAQKKKLDSLKNLDHSTTYLNFINEIQTHLSGTIANFDRLLEKTKKEKKSRINFLKPSSDKMRSKFILYAQLLGGKVFCVPQENDGLMGSTYQKSIFQKNNEFIDNTGNCYGKVVTWAHLTRTGQALSGKCFITDENIYEAQKRQTSDPSRNKKIEFFDPPAKYECYADTTITWIINLLKYIKEDKIYEIRFSEHVMGIRKVVGTPVYEIMEPNFGIILFDDEKKLTDWLSIYLCLYYPKENGAGVEAICDNNFKDNSLYQSIFSQNNAPVKLSPVVVCIFENIISALNTKFKVSQENNTHHNIPKHAEEACLTLLKHLTNEKSVLSDLKNFLLTDEDTSFLKYTSGDAIEKMISTFFYGKSKTSFDTLCEKIDSMLSAIKPIEAILPRHALSMANC